LSTAATAAGGAATAIATATATTTAAAAATATSTRQPLDGHATGPGRAPLRLPPAAPCLRIRLCPGHVLGRDWWPSGPGESLHYVGPEWFTNGPTEA